MVIVIVAASIADGSDEGEVGLSPVSTTATDAVGSGIGTAELPPTAQETTTTTPRAASCATASETYVAVINASFKEQGLSLSSPAYAVEAPGGLTYIGANIMRGDIKESSADVWVARDVAVFSLSGSAREYSTLPDGRRLLDASAGDDYGTEVQDCVIGRR